MAQKLGQERSLSHIGVITVMGLLGVVLPVQAQVTPGQDELGTEVQQRGDRFIIQGGTSSRNGANLFHSFEDFGLSPEQWATFRTDAEVQTILGRVVGGNPSLIDGLIRVTGSNADLVLMNPAGILFGPNARLDIPASFTATSADRVTFGDRFFSSTESSDYRALVDQPDGFTFRLSEPGAIVNAGQLRVDPGASITLLGGTVVNTGTLIAPGGTITLAAVEGEQYVRIQSEGMLLSLDLEAAPTASGTLPLTAPNLPELLTLPGLRHATGVQVNPDGTVVLTGSQISIPTAGTAIASGRLTTASSESQESQINILGDRVGVFDATVNVSGPEAGQVRIGGGYRGGDPIPNAQTTVVGSDVQIRANATAPQAEGGNVVLWSDGTTSFAGRILARGGPAGQGGRVEISGRDSLRYRGDVRTRTVDGSPGVLLLDPENIIVVAGIGPTDDDGQLADQQILAGDAPGSTFTISQAALEAALLSADVILEATNNIRIEPLAGGQLEGSTAAFSLTFIADADTDGRGTFRMSRNDTISTFGGNLRISAARIIAGNLDTGDGFDGGGSIDLVASSGIEVGNLTTSGFFTDSGDIRIFSSSDIRVGGIDTSPITEGGNEAGSVTILSVNDPDNLALDLRTLTSADELTNPAGNVTVDYINTANFFGTGGDVTLTGDRVLITERTFDQEGAPSIDTRGNIFIPFEPIEPFEPIGPITPTPPGADSSGQVRITHAGGPDNVPFTVGDVSNLNGTAFDIVTGTVTLTEGTANSVFPVPVTGENIRTFDNISGEERIRITGVNAAPTLTAIATPIEIDIGQSIRLTYENLQLLVRDRNNDNTIVRLVAVLGELRRNGVLLAPGDIISPGDELDYSPPAGETGLIPNAITLSAGDFNQGIPILAESAPVAIAVDIQSEERPERPEHPEQPERPERPERPGPPEITLPPGAICPPFCGAEPPEQAQPPLPGESPIPIATIDEGQIVLQTIEEETGVKPAIIYVDFVPRTLTLTHDFNALETSTTGDIANHLDRFIEPTLRVIPEPSPDDILELLLVTPSGDPIRVTVPGVTRQQVQATADSMRQQITNRLSRPQQYLPPSQQLYTWLMTPILADLQEQEIENLVFIMTAGLRSLPVAALHDGNQFLVEQYSLGLMPSLSLTDTRYVDIRDTSVLAMGASEFTDQLPLPGVPLEVQGITEELWRGQTFLNEAFTSDNLRFQRSQTPYGIVHLATHGEFKPGNLANSYIQLWDQQLSLSDIRQLGLDSPAAELLVLSACRTALGDETAELGFAGSAVQAGVKSVLASLWYVSDRATLVFMREFYTQLRTAPIKSHALQAAQQAMLQGDWQVEQGQLVDREGDRLILPPSLVFDGSGDDLSHPFYWAAFTMVGNPW